jgi:hypothetical protein
MSRSIRALGALLALFLSTAGLAHAQANPPDHYLCYAAGAAPNKKLPPISKERVDLQDRYGGPQRFALRRLASLCNPASLGGGGVSHHNVHLTGLNLKTVKGTPKLVPFTQGVRDALATRTLALTALAAVLDVSPAQPGTTAPADFSDDPTRTGTETNRFKCYSVSHPKGAPKFVPPPPPTVFDEVYPNGQPFLIKKITRLCVPADVDGGTPGAETRDTLLVCYGVKLPKGARFPRQMIGTRSRTVGVRIVGRRKPIELCVAGRVFPGS